MDGYLATSTLGSAPMMIVDVPTVHMPTMTEVNSGVPNAGATPAAQFNCSIAGLRIAYDQQTLNGPYKNKGSYISAVNRRLMELVGEGWMLPEYAEDVRADAQAIDIPPPGQR